MTHLFTCAVPYLPATEQYIPLEAIVKFLPSLGYQLQFGSKEGLIESHTQDKAGIRNFLNALYGGRTADGKGAMTPENGADLELMPTLGRSPLISEDELNYYVEEYSRHGLHAPCKCLLRYHHPHNSTNNSQATTTATARPTMRPISHCWRLRTALRSSARLCS